MAHDGPEHDSVEEAAERLISLAEAAELFELSHIGCLFLQGEGGGA